MDESSTEPRNTLLMRPPKRDLRLDFMRGIGQWIIFLDHIPNNFVNWFTLRNFGFSDLSHDRCGS
jgi:hypothetical protein